jgi:hypothetical protein
MSNSLKTQTQISDFSTNEAVGNLLDDFPATPSLGPIRDPFVVLEILVCQVSLKMRII